MTQAISLKEVFEANDTSKALREHFANRKRHRSKVDIYRTRNKLLRKGDAVVNEDLVETFKKLEAKGLGVFKKKDQFTPFYSLKLIGQAATEGKELEPIKAAKSPVQQTVSEKPRPARGRPKGSRNKKTLIAQARKQAKIKSVTQSASNPLRLNVVIELPKELSSLFASVKQAG